jgi:DNA-binding IclR family transcriptional regulator
MASSPGGLRLVEKCVEVLDLLAEHGDLTIAEMAVLIDEPRSSLYRLMASLEQLSLVEPASERGHFRLGMHILRLARALQANIDVRDRALPTMQAIRKESGLTVYLVVRRGREGVCVERVEGHRVASLALRLGESLPLHVGAAPRALLAFEPEEAWHAYVDADPLEQYTPSTPSASTLFEVLAAERDRGYTISDGDVTAGIASLGAPVRDESGAVVAALSVSGLRDDVLGSEELPGMLLAGAEEVSRAMGN